MEHKLPPTETGCVDGIINLLDAVQDAIVSDGVKTEEEVFGKSITI